MSRVSTQSHINLFMKYDAYKLWACLSGTCSWSNYNTKCPARKSLIVLTEWAHQPPERGSSPGCSTASDIISELYGNITLSRPERLATVKMMSQSPVMVVLINCGFLITHKIMWFCLGPLLSPRPLNENSFWQNTKKGVWIFIWFHGSLFGPTLKQNRTLRQKAENGLDVVSDIGVDSWIQF